MPKFTLFRVAMDSGAYVKFEDRDAWFLLQYEYESGNLSLTGDGDAARALGAQCFHEFMQLHTAGVGVPDCFEAAWRLAKKLVF